MKHRFFMDSKDITGDEIALTGENAAHAAVLRLAPGEEIAVCDGAAMDYHCVVTFCSRHETRAKVMSKTANTAEPSIDITLYQALPKVGKMDEIAEKCTQLGIFRIVPVITARCITKPSDRDVKKIDRWQKIARAAAAQGQRGKIPRISNVMTLEAALQQVKTHDAAFACYENENRLSLKTFLQNLPESLSSGSGDGIAPHLVGAAIGRPQSLGFSMFSDAQCAPLRSMPLFGYRPLSSMAFFIGPEGGFDEDEAAKLREGGIATVSLGPRILRTELAGAVVLANILYELGL